MIFLASVAVEVLFEFDSARIPEGTSDRLAEVVEWAEAHPEAKIVVDGHADYIGTPEYNVGLSLRRAKSVRSQLKMAGVENEIILVGYGEDAPSRGERRLDRRVGVQGVDDPLYTIIDDALDPATAVLWDEPKTVAQIEGPERTEVSFR